MRFAQQVGLIAFCIVTLVIHGRAFPAELNVLLITADDLGVQLGCYGDTAAHTPNLDRLAAQGCLFENAYVAQASCSPSRSAMFTGLYPHTNGQYGLLNAGVGFQLTPAAQQQTIPKLLKPAGFSTGILGKLHVGQESLFPFDNRIRGDTRDVKKIVSEAANFFQEAEGPFFFMANFSDPHVYGRSPRPPKEAFPTQYKGIPSEPIQLGEVPSFPFQRLDVPEQIVRTTQYYNASKRFDVGVGLLLDALREAGHGDNTLIIFIGDHGPPFLRGKTSCYEGGVKVPLLVVWPDVIQPGSRSSALVSAVDILPTILDAVGLELPKLLHGKSLRTATTDETFREYVTTEFHYHGSRTFLPRRAIRDERFKLIHNMRAGEVLSNGSVDGDHALQLVRNTPQIPDEVLEAFERCVDPPEFELYDLQEDPWEYRNLATDTNYQKELQRLTTALMDWRRATDDPLLDPKRYAEVADYENRKP